MFSPKEASKILMQKHKNTKLVDCIEYEDCYIFCGVEPSGYRNYYSVDKKTGRIEYYSPAGEIDKFINAIENHRVNWH